MNYQAAYNELIKWIQSLLAATDKAELSAMRHLATCQQSYNNAVADHKKDATAKDRLARAAKELESAEKTRDWNWIAGAILEVIAFKSVSVERRLRLPPTILEWADDVATAAS